MGRDSLMDWNKVIESLEKEDVVERMAEAASKVCSQGEWNTSEDAFDALRTALRPFLKEGE